MALSSQEIVNLGKDFDSKDIRICMIDGVKHASVINVIQAICGGQNSRSTWSRLKEAYPNLINQCKTHKFPGPGPETCVAEAHVMMNIVFKLPGKHASQFCEGAATTFLQFLNPTPEFVEELESRIDGLKDEREHGFIVSVSDRPTQRAYTETSFYVRISLPPEHRVKVLNHKELTLQIIKFGIMFNIHQRDVGYDQDNGYFAFSFLCRSREETDLVEIFMKNEFKTITVLGSKEYIDAVRLGEQLGVSYDGMSYETYIEVARTLFVKMVERLKLNYPGVYDNMYGTMYSVVEKVQTITKTDKNTPTRIEFPADTITADLASSFGFRQPATEWKVIGEASAPLVQRPKSNGKVISCHLETGVEKEHSTAERGAKDLGLEPKNVRSSVDEARHCGGYVWRSMSAVKKWVVPEGLHVDPTKHESHIEYVKGVDDKGVQVVFENRMVAARSLNRNYDKFKGVVGSGKKVDGMIWTFVPKHEFNTFVDNVDTSVPRAIFLTGPDNGADGRSNGKVISRDILTGEEIEYVSVNNASTKTGVRGSFISERLGRPMQAKGMVFRRFDSLERWEPPTYFKFRTTNDKGDPIKFENGCSIDNYIISLDEDGNVCGMYENIIAAAQLTGTHRSGLNNLDDVPRLVKKLRWRKAVPSDYNNFVPCTPPTSDD